MTGSMRQNLPDLAHSGGAKYIVFQKAQKAQKVQKVQSAKQNL